MSAEVETMAYAGEVPWHGIGTEMAEPMFWEEATQFAGLDWEVGKGNLYGGPKNQKYKDRFSLYRVTDGKPLGICGSTYKIIQPAEAFSRMDKFVAGGELRWETLGSLFEGRRIWGLARLDDMEIVVNGLTDPHRQYALMSTGFDGLSLTGEAFKVWTVDVRVVCNNTYAAAIRGRSAAVKIAHSGDIDAKFSEAATTFQLVTAQHKRYQEWLASLAEVEVDDNFVAEFKGELFHFGDEKATPQEKSAAVAFDNLLEVEFAKVGGVAYSVYNAATGYGDHILRVKPREDKAQRMLSMMGGNGAHMKDKAVAAISKLAGVATPF